MDKATRGYIESVIDEGIRKELISNLEWIGRDRLIHVSLRDFLLGYTIGALHSLAMGIVTFSTGQPVSDEDTGIIRAMLRRRIPMIMEKINRELHR